MQSGQIVVMDNLSAHKHSQVREKIEQCGRVSTLSATVLPPTSTHRKVLGQDQGMPRAAKARLVDTLDQAIAATITPQNSTHWLKHCGSRTQLP